MSKRMELYNEGLTDHEIAEKEGVANTTIATWRYKNDLSANGIMTSEEKEKIKELNRKGKTDQEIAEILDWSWQAIGAARRKMGLETPRHIKNYEEEVYKMYKQGMPDKEIAEKISMTPSAIGHWRRRNNLESMRKRRNRKRLNLYKEGMSDQEIADRLGLTRTAICAWRHREGLEINHPIDDEKAYELYTEGLSDKKISKEFDVSPSTIHNWREENNLPPNHEPVEYIPEETKLEIEDYYYEGFNDKEIAEQLDISPATVFLYRCHNDLPSHNPSPKNLSEAEQQKRINLYEQGLLDAEMAEHLSISTGGVTSWRKRNNLPSNHERWGK